MWKAILILLAALVVAFLLWRADRPRDPGPGRVAPEQPVQKLVSDETRPFAYKGITITPLAAFQITARVLAAEDYFLGREADLFPVDLALGWGPMSDSKVLAKLKISQGERYYHWETKGEEFPIPREEIEHNSANMHLIPATEEVSSRVNTARAGDVVTFSGWLVEARAADGWCRRSSLTRNDTGAGACELVWVTQFSLAPPRRAAVAAP